MSRARCGFVNRFLALVVTGLVMSVPQASFAKERLFVMLDHAKILRLEGQASTIILGNPAIADASVFDKSMLVITGKSYGTTNLVVLDNQGEEVTSTTITVRAADERLVTVHRGASRESFDCSPNCQPSLVLGDNAETFNAINGQISNRIAISEGAPPQ